MIKIDFSKNLEGVYIENHIFSGVPDKEGYVQCKECELQVKGLEEWISNNSIFDFTKQKDSKR